MDKLTAKTISPSREIAYIAVMCALTIGGQYALSFVAGVEIVTLLISSFAYVFGIRRGVILSLSFSILRCFIFGFYLNVIILYVLYYPFLSFIFGSLGKIKDETYGKIGFSVCINILLILIAFVCAYLSLNDLIKISRLLKVTVYSLMWTVFAACIGLAVFYDTLLILNKVFKKDTKTAVKLIALVSSAAVCTILFTLIDDVISPIIYGLNRDGALAYFYASFAAMLPQTVCTIVTTLTLILPLTSILNKFKGSETAKL